MSAKRILSGVRATGDLHLGNYLGALKHWVATQGDADCFFFIADLHGLTELTPQHDAREFKERRLKTVATFLAAGIDPQVSTLFFQSAVVQHTELMWLLATVARKGELERMTQWKDKAGSNQAGSSAALFAYPVLMAADILLYDADEVPVGDDQRQHVEVTRDWALRFNSYFGETFKVPVATIPPEGARVMDLLNPQNKMSKTAASPGGSILLTDSADEIRAKVRRSVTDTVGQVNYGPEQPGVSNLLDILSALTGRDVPALVEHFAGLGYGALKTEVTDAVIAAVEPMRLQIADLMGDPTELQNTLEHGALRARDVADQVVVRARNALGLDGYSP